MRSLSRAVPIIIAVAAAAAPASAQEDHVARRSFPFFDRSLTVEIQGDGAGVLHVVRGARSRVEVAAHAAPGVASFTLGGWQRNRLRLTAAGDDAVEYIVIVPERVSLRVQLPGRAYPVLAEPGSGTYRWDDPRPGGSPGSAEPGLPCLDASAPGQILNSDRGAISRNGVRFADDDSRVGGR